MSYYRTPEERVQDQREMARIVNALDDARRNLASWIYLVEDDGDAKLVERWVDICYDQLRAALTHQELLRTVLHLLVDDAHRLVRHLREAPS